MTDHRRLTGKVAIVTGAAQGIGAVYATALAAEGAAVAICDVLDPAATAAAVKSRGSKVYAATVDVTHSAAVANFVQHAERELGPVDILVNNAALFGGLARKPFTDISAEEWDRVMMVNTRSVLECTKAVVPSMRARRSGKIINIASSTVHSGTPFLLHYVASKGAVIAMTRSMARELGEHGIAVNCLAPGLTMSEATKQGTAAAVAAIAIQGRAFKRDEEPEDLIGPLIFLASDDSGFVTGQTIVVDGGAIMH